MYWRSLITVSLGFLITWHHNGISSAAEPGYLDFDNLPDTNFSCERKVIGGYYADIETGCQMFHVCTIGQKGEITDIKFLCLNGTVFDQETRVCERLDEVDCSKSESFFDLNLELYGNNAAGFGIQPEGEESEDLFEKCNPDSDDDCNTDSPSTKNESQESHEETIEEEIIEEVEETTTTAPVTSSTTTRRPLPSSTTGLPSTTPSPPKVYNYPTSSQETVAALLALHNAFTASLQQHADPQKPKPNPPRITGFINTNPSSTNSGGFHNQHHSSLTPPRPPTQFTPPSATDHLQNFQSQKQNYQHHNNKPNNFQNPVQTTSEHYGNGNFHHEFHINSQTGHFPVQNFQDNYHQQHQSASAIPQTSHPKPFQFHQFDDNDYYVKTHSSTVTPFILHQLKVNRLKENQDSSTGSVTHGSYVRDVSSAGKSHKNSPFRSQTTPAIAVVTSTSTTSSSSSTKNGKYNPSAILNRQPQTKQFAHSTNPSGFVSSIDHRNKNSTQNRQTHLSNYDDYQESDVHSDPFFKDVPKIGRSKRYAQFNAQRTNRRQRPRVAELPLPQSESDEPKINNLTTLQPPTNRRNNRRRPSTYISRESLPLETPVVQPIMNINQERKQINTPSISNTRPLEDLPNIEVNTQQIPARRTHRRKHVTVIKSTTEETVTVYSEENIVPPSTPQTPGSKFTCDNKIKGGYYADTEANCLGFFICSQGEVNGPLLKTHFWCGATTKFNQRSRTCQAEDNVVCSISERYYHLNQDFLVPAPEDEIRDSFEPQKVQK